ncbi:MAG: hypothetical protein IPM01_26210 [Burkholderiaceae bacterium]|nr:hypothetical protein [Burkholderiaceae bacterium]
MRLELVEFMPSALEPGVLYVSKKYHTAAHLCACGCGEKIRTQLGPLGWQFTNGRQGPSLYPSIGNWQKPCRSHYYIKRGFVVWALALTEAEVLYGRREEIRRRDAYFREQSLGYWARLTRWWNARR